MTNDPKPYGPSNPHPLSQLRTELVWAGKSDEFARRRPVSLPTFPLVMPRVETIDEPCGRSKAQGTLFEPTTAHRDDFRNRRVVHVEDPITDAETAEKNPVIWVKGLVALCVLTA